MPSLLNCDGFLKLKNHCATHSCETNTVKKHHPILAYKMGASQAWRKIVRVRKDVEHGIWWKQKEGTTSFWMDNWIKRALYYIKSQGVDEEVEVN